MVLVWSAGNGSPQAGRKVGAVSDRRLFGKMVAVVSTNRKDEIAYFSKGCGDAMYWCMAAPGDSIRTTDYDHSSSRDVVVWKSGTSISTPYVSGALAVLRSRLTSMLMSVVLAVLFYTAKDLGDPGVDDLYGHGLVDLGAAVSLQGTVRLAVPGSAGLAGSRMSLPFALRGAGGRVGWGVGGGELFW